HEALAQRPEPTRSGDPERSRRIFDHATDESRIECGVGHHMCQATVAPDAEEPSAVRADPETAVPTLNHGGDRHVEYSGADSDEAVALELPQSVARSDPDDIRRVD